MTDLPCVSFIVPVRNDRDRLARCLQSIAASAYPADCVEVVVVDSGSTDDSVDVARRAGATVMTLQGSNVAELRNAGSRRARGEILAFVDADHEIGAGWLRSAVEDLWRHGVGAVGALCHAPLDGTWVQRTYDRFRARTPGCYEVEWLGSGNLAIRRDVFERAGGFDVSLETCEDVELCQRIRALGFRILNDDRLRNVHLGDPATLGHLFRGELWRGRDNLRVSLRGPWSWRALPSIAIPIIDLAMVPLALVGLVLAPLRGTAGGSLTLVTVALAVMLALVSLRVAAMSRRARLSVRGLGQAFAVAAVYDAARALALVARAPHRTHRTTAPPDGSTTGWESETPAWTMRKVA
ncbi:MAG: glycosyltransferase [Acidobacteria bacterium]|nr:glycosyltransferase [Acidobacteriota bacterium]